MNHKLFPMILLVVHMCWLWFVLCICVVKRFLIAAAGVLTVSYQFNDVGN